MSKTTSNMCCPKKPDTSLKYIINWIDGVKAEDLKPLFDDYATNYYEWQAPPVIESLQTSVAALRHDIGELQLEVTRLGNNFQSKLDKPDSATEGNIAVWGSGKTLLDSTRSIAASVTLDSEDLVTSGGVYTALQNLAQTIILSAGNNISITNGEINAEGYTYNPAKNSFKTGNDTYSEGTNSFSEGFHNDASGDYSHAEGSGTTSSSTSSHSEGYETTASGASSHAEGSYTIASGFSSHAGGEGTIANQSGMTAIGKYNANGVQGELFSIGYGSSINRNTIFNILGIGDAGISGTCSVNIKGTLNTSGTINTSNDINIVNNISKLVFKSANNNQIAEVSGSYEEGDIYFNILSDTHTLLEYGDNNLTLFDDKLSITSDGVNIDGELTVKEVTINEDNITNLQRALTDPDSVPESGSDNLIKSGSVYDALAEKMDTRTIDNVPTNGHTTQLVTSGGVYTAIQAAQLGGDVAFDDTPTIGSTNPVKSEGIKQALNEKISYLDPVILIKDAQGFSWDTGAEEETLGAIIQSCSPTNKYGVCILNVYGGTLSSLYHCYVGYVKYTYEQGTDAESGGHLVRTDKYVVSIYVNNTKLTSTFEVVCDDGVPYDYNAPSITISTVSPIF